MKDNLKYIKFTTSIDHRNAMVTHAEAVEQLRERGLVEYMNDLALESFGTNCLRINEQGFYLESCNNEILGKPFDTLYNSLNSVILAAYPKDTYLLDYEIIKVILFSINEETHFKFEENKVVLTFSLNEEIIKFNFELDSNEFNLELSKIIIPSGGDDKAFSFKKALYLIDALESTMVLTNQDKFKILDFIEKCRKIIFKVNDCAERDKFLATI